MPFRIRKKAGKYEVVGPYKDKKVHVYGTHEDKESAREQQKALYTHATNESAEFNGTIVKHLENSHVKDPNGVVEDIPAPPPGMEKADPKESYPKTFRPSLFKLPMRKTGVNERHIMDFNEFLQRINYRTHDGILQKGHGQNLTGGK